MKTRAFKSGEWRAWFAWRPVRMWNGFYANQPLVWLEMVDRQIYRFPNGRRHIFYRPFRWDEKEAERIKEMNCAYWARVRHEEQMAREAENGFVAALVPSKN